MNKHDVANAVSEMVEEFHITKPWEQSGHFTCGELDAIARVHLAAGDGEGARNWLAGHSWHDENPATTETGDRHFHLADHESGEDNSAAIITYIEENL